MAWHLHRLSLGDKILGFVVSPLIGLYGIYCLLAGDGYLAVLHHWSSNPDRDFLDVSGAAAFRVGLAYLAFGLALHVTGIWKCHDRLGRWYVPVGLTGFVLGLLAYLWAIAAV